MSCIYLKTEENRRKRNGKGAHPKEFNQKKKKMKKEVFPAKANPKENLPELATIVSEHGDWRLTTMMGWFGVVVMTWWFGATTMVDSLSFSHFDPLFLSLRFSLSD